MTQGLVTDFDDAPGYGDFKFNKISKVAQQNLDAGKPSEKLAVPKPFDESSNTDTARLLVSSLKKRFQRPLLRNLKV